MRGLRLSVQTRSLPQRQISYPTAVPTPTLHTGQTNGNRPAPEKSKLNGNGRDIAHLRRQPSQQKSLAWRKKRALWAGPTKRLWNLVFWPHSAAHPRGLASVMEPGDRIVEGGREFILIITVPTPCLDSVSIALTADLIARPYCRSFTIEIKSKNPGSHRPGIP